jgi:hypothetical protein
MKLLARVMLSVWFSCAFASLAGAQPAPPKWSLGMGVNGSYEGNALFTGPEDNEEFAHQVFATIGRSWTEKRGGAQLMANVNQVFFHETASLNNFMYTVGGTGSYAITRRLTWSGGSTVTSGLARDSKVLTEEAGLVLPSVIARTGSSTSSLGYALTRRSSMNWTLSQIGVGFSGGATPFSGGSTIGSNFGYSHLVGKSQSFGISQDYRRTFNNGSSDTMLGFFGTWSYAAGGGWTAAASAGVSPYLLATAASYQLTSTFGGNFTKLVRPGQTVGVSYNKGIEQTFGTDRTSHLVQTIYGNYGLTVLRKAGLSFGGSYSRGYSPLTPDLIAIGETAQASIAFPLTTSLNIAFGSSVFSRVEGPSPRVTSTRTFLSLGYNTSWR